MTDFAKLRTAAENCERIGLKLMHLPIPTVLELLDRAEKYDELKGMANRYGLADWGTLQALADVTKRAERAEAECGVLLQKNATAEARVAELEADRDSWKTLAEGHCVDHLQAHEIAAELEEARAAIERVRKVVNCSCGRCVAFRGGGMHTNGPCELTPRNLNDALKGAE